MIILLYISLTNNHIILKEDFHGIHRNGISSNLYWRNRLESCKEDSLIKKENKTHLVFYFFTKVVTK